MSDEGAAKHPRPSQVTMAGWVTVSASALLLFALFEDISGLRSLALREGVAEYLSQPPGSSISLGVEEVLGLLRVGLMVAGACAAATLVLGVHVLKRNKAARIAMIVPALYLFLCALVAPMTGSFLAVLVAVSAVLLWSRPANDWFAGRTPLSRKDPTMSEQYPGRRPDDQQPPQQPQQPQQPPYEQPAYPQPGQQPQSYGQQAYGQQPYQPWPGAAPSGQPSDKRPGTVTAAAWLTWVFTAITALIATVMVGVFAAASDEIVTELRADPVWTDLQGQLDAAGLTIDDVTTMLVVFGIIAIIWCLIAFVVAVFAFRRQNWARIVLVVSAAVSALLSLVMIASIVTVVPLAASIATIVLLFVGGANDWYARRGAPAGGPYGQGYPGQGYPGQGPQDPPKPW